MQTKTPSNLPLQTGRAIRFLSLMRWRSKNRHSVVWPKQTPCSARAARISASVASLLQHSEDRRGVRFNLLRAVVATLFLRPDVALSASKRAPADRARGADAKPCRRLAAG
jgi:hypothetical protein